MFVYSISIGIPPIRLRKPKAIPYFSSTFLSLLFSPFHSEIRRLP